MKYFTMSILVILQEEGIIQLYDTWKHLKECSTVKSIKVRQLITALVPLPSSPKLPLFYCIHSFH